MQEIGRKEIMVRGGYTKGGIGEWLKIRIKSFPIGFQWGFLSSVEIITCAKEKAAGKRDIPDSAR
jgi:hypothetical protein